MTQLPHLPPGLRELLPAHVALGFMPVVDLSGTLPDLERSVIVHAVPKRRREFATGRVLARALLRQLGVHAEAIDQRDDRTPDWPDGVVGSISHCHDLALVAVGRTRDGVRSIGVDVEPAEPLERNLWNDIACDAERTQIDAGSLPPGMAMRRLFSAKEAVFKCLYPLNEQLLGFHDVAVTFHSDYDRFEARLQANDVPALVVPEPIAGRQLTWERWILTTAIWQ